MLFFLKIFASNASEQEKQAKNREEKIGKEMIKRE